MPSETVAILLCTMQGQRYLSDQLESIMLQEHKNWTIWVSDDGSSDDTHSILKEYQQKLGPARMSIHAGPEEGFAANFLSLACKASVTADYYAFADQDDIWDVDKLSQALRWLRTVPAHLPALYCGRTKRIDSNNVEKGYSKLFLRKPCFANALVQSIAGGNTMVFNSAARRFLRKAGPDIKVVSHDWWAYMVVSGCGGKVFYDPNPKVRYRQHENNLVGDGSGWLVAIERLRMVLQGRFQSWNEVNVNAIQTMRAHLTPENKAVLDVFASARKANLFKRLLALKRSGVHRQTVVGNIGLIAAGILNKI